MSADVVTERGPVRDHCLAPTRTVDAPLAGGRYRSLFKLPPLRIDGPLLHTLGGLGGACEVVRWEQRDGADESNTAAGWPLFGQFIAHDITADRSPLSSDTEVLAPRNSRSPRLNLECIYGAGPVGQPYLYERRDPAKLLLATNDDGMYEDLPRNPQGTALIGDPRNDVHTIIAQFHLAVLKLHNGLVDRLRGDGVAEADVFTEAQQATCWHYQWIVVHEFLPLLVGPTLTAELLSEGPRWYRPTGDSFIPVEFADAAYRYGHSQIRETYQLNGHSPASPLFPNLLGFRPIPPDCVIDWSYLFDLPGHAMAQRARKIDGHLPNALMRLPGAITGEVDVEDLRSLAARDLQRGHRVGLPSGEAVSRHVGVEPLSEAEIGLRALGWRDETPLWYYLLREADVCEGGEHLGPVGGRIVGEVLLGLLGHDPAAQRPLDPDWRPTLPSVTSGSFTMADLLGFARRVESAGHGNAGDPR